MRVTGALLKVLRALLEEPGAETYGLDLLRATHLKSGTVYPLLDRLELAGWVTSRWEDVDPAAEGRPRRRLYTLTGAGFDGGWRLLVEYSAASTSWAVAR